VWLRLFSLHSKHDCWIWLLLCNGALTTRSMTTMTSIIFRNMWSMTVNINGRCDWKQDMTHSIWEIWQNSMFQTHGKHCSVFYLTLLTMLTVSLTNCLLCLCMLLCCHMCFVSRLISQWKDLCVLAICDLVRLRVIVIKLRRCRVCNFAVLVIK